MLSAAGAAALLAAAVLLARPVPRGRPVPAPVWLVALALLVWLAMVLVPLEVLLPAVIVSATAAGLLLVRTRQRRAAVAAGTGQQVQEVCEVIAAELGAGLPAARSLRSSAQAWPPMEEAAVAHDLGASVPDKLRELAGRPGADDLRLVAAAWQLAHRSGAGLAGALTAVGQGLREAGTTRRLVRSELASARSTARLMAGLPVLTLVMGSGSGGDPVGFLVGSGIGLGCLAAGAVLTVAGLWWIESIAASVEGGLQ